MNVTRPVVVLYDEEKSLKSVPPTVPSPLRAGEWRHLHPRLDDSIKVFPAVAGESQFLFRDSNNIRIARLTNTSFRLIDLERSDLLALSFPLRTTLLHHPPLLTQHGLRFSAKVKEMHTPAVVSTHNNSSSTFFLNVLDVEDRVQTQLKGPPGTDTEMLAVSPDGLRLAALWIGDGAWTLTVYDADSGKPVASWGHVSGNVWDVVFSPDGTRVATGGEDGITRLWNTTTGTVMAECRGHTRKVLSVAFRPVGRRLATTSGDGTVRQWDATTGREVEWPYDRHTREVRTVKYSDDGRWIASGGTDRTVRVWDAANHEDLCVLQGHVGDVSYLEFTAAGRGLVSVSQSTRLYNSQYEDGTIRLGLQSRRTTPGGYG